MFKYGWYVFKFRKALWRMQLIKHNKQNLFFKGKGVIAVKTDQGKFE